MVHSAYRVTIYDILIYVYINSVLGRGVLRTLE